ncbi:hypothetical protein SAMN05216553_10454 [Lentzea fradiae]|uniref:Uncharacterized protein n=2 Tax=Lentzea fradiae TaxID=200378 RepID=A0A1G7PSU6_9PSEU|nr:hypothetical protein SAMN05216553_10454 [Lentzea fradiae]
MFRRCANRRRDNDIPVVVPVVIAGPEGRGLLSSSAPERQFGARNWAEWTTIGPEKRPPGTFRHAPNTSDHLR